MNAFPPYPLPEPRWRKHMPPSPAVVILGSAAFCVGLAGTAALIAIYKAAESIFGGKP